MGRKQKVRLNSECPLFFALTEQSQPGPASEAMTAALMTECLVCMFRQLTTNRDSSLRWLMALEDEQLGRAIDRILENPGANYTVELLAETAAMSRSAFAERLNTAFGVTPMGLVYHIRMQRACQLLRESRRSILNGHLKSGHLGSPQNRPLVESVRDRVVLAFCLLVRQVYFSSPTARAAF